MTKQEEAQLALEQYGSRSKAAQALGLSKTGFRNRLMGIVQTGRHDVNEEQKQATIEVSPATGGFSLAGRSLLATKPTDIWKSRFYALRRGMGYTIEHLADQWGNSIDTIKQKARRFGALRYVEDTNKPGCYIACIVHPDTPKGR